jgi:hypothetical protein
MAESIDVGEFAHALCFVGLLTSTNLPVLEITAVNENPAAGMTAAFNS